MNGTDIALKILEKRGKGWVVQSIQDMSIPVTLPYAADCQAWTICLMKQWNELGDEPWWLKGTDQETHQMYYAEMGEAARTVSRIELVLAIWSRADEQLFLFPTKAQETKPQDGVIPLSFIIEFPELLVNEPVEGN